MQVHQLTLLSVSDTDACRPCNNSEILMAVCTSDFGELNTALTPLIILLRCNSIQTKKYLRAAKK